MDKFRLSQKLTSARFQGTDILLLVTNYVQYFGKLGSGCCRHIFYFREFSGAFKTEADKGKNIASTKCVCSHYR